MGSVSIDAATKTGLEKSPRSAPQMAGEEAILQPPKVASIQFGSAVQPHSWVQGRSALPDMLLANIIVGQYCVSLLWRH